MGYRREPIEVGEWYHCYNRGIDKRTVFESQRDCERFQQVLYLSNSNDHSQRKNFDYRHHKEIFNVRRDNPIVSVGAYALMPNHFHILLQEITEGGISRFMHKVGTSYTMHFNLTRQRTGNLFTKPFRSRHIGSEPYFRRVVQYIHLNPAEIFEKGWRVGKIGSLSRLERNLRSYPYSSLPDYLNQERTEASIVSPEALELLGKDLPSFSSIVNDAFEYYQQLEQ